MLLYLIKMPTYHDRIMEVLSETQGMDVPDIIQAIECDKTKQTYVIDAIKKGIGVGAITKINNPNSKTLYRDHTYTKNS
jgi:hypothetical protein